jgi:hypothetical protein
MKNTHDLLTPIEIGVCMGVVSCHVSQPIDDLVNETGLKVMASFLIDIIGKIFCSCKSKNVFSKTQQGCLDQQNF